MPAFNLPYITPPVKCVPPPVFQMSSESAGLCQSNAVKNAGFMVLPVSLESVLIYSAWFVCALAPI